MSDTKQTTAGGEAVVNNPAVMGAGSQGPVAPNGARTDYEKRDLPAFDEAGAPTAQGPANLEMVLDIQVTLAMEIGRTRMTINELLHLSQGTVVELNRPAGSPMDILANGTLIAHGEVVVVNDRFGIRLTDVVSPAERIKGLK